MLEPSSFSMVSDSRSRTGTGQRAARVVDAWKRDFSVYAVIAYSVPVRLSVTVALLLPPLLFLRLRVHVYVPYLSRLCMRLSVSLSLTRVCASGYSLISTHSLERVPRQVSPLSR